MIEVSVAIDTALQLFRSVYKELVEAEEILDLQVEEVELSEDERFWTIALGYSRQGEANPTTVGLSRMTMSQTRTTIGIK